MAPISEHQRGAESCSECTRAYWGKKVLSVLLLISLSIAFVACTTGSTPPQATRQPTPTPSPTPAGPPAGTVLYQSDWSKGLTDWHASPGWKVVNGMLLSDLSSNNSLTVPYLSSAPNYRLEVRFQIVSVPQNGGYFVVIADRTSGKDGYTAGIQGLLSPAPHSEFAQPEITVYLNPEDAMESTMEPHDFNPGTSWHTFRIDVQGSDVAFFTDNQAESRADSSQTSLLSNGPFHVVSDQAIVRVSSINITAL